jgi:hypothetical protein
MKEDEMGGACNAHGETKMRKNFGWKPKGKRPLGRARRRWENYIK